MHACFEYSSMSCIKQSLPACIHATSICVKLEIISIKILMFIR